MPEATLVLPLDESSLVVFREMKIGEVDTKPQFKSVKDTISLFSGDAFTESKSITKMSRPCLLERGMSKDLEQHLVHNELYEMKRQINSANLSNRKVYLEFEEIKLARDMMNRKPFNLNASGELASSTAGNVTPFLIEAVNKEDSSFKNVLESLELELKRLKKERSKLMVEELLSESTCSSLKTQKLELNACLVEEFAARGQFDGLLSALRQMLLETKDARKQEDDDVKLKVEELQKHAEAASSSLSLLENEIRLALEETEKAKSSEVRILSQIKILSEKAMPSSKNAKPDCITIPEEEFEYLIQKIHETDKVTEMKVAAAREQIEAAKAVEHKTLKKLKGRKKQIEDMQAILNLASKRAQVAEAAKKELRKQHKREENKSASRTSTRTETSTYDHLTKASKHKFVPGSR